LRRYNSESNQVMTATMVLYFSLKILENAAQNKNSYCCNRK